MHHFLTAKDSADYLLRQQAILRSSFQAQLNFIVYHECNAITQIRQPMAAATCFLIWFSGGCRSSGNQDPDVARTALARVEVSMEQHRILVEEQGMLLR